MWQLVILTPLKKNVFSVYEGNSVLKLASALLSQGAYHYAAATSMYGLLSWSFAR
jgi:hypothetical protein